MQTAKQAALHYSLSLTEISERFVMSDLDMLSIGLINDMYVESRNDDCNYAALATQEDMDKF